MQPASCAQQVAHPEVAVAGNRWQRGLAAFRLHRGQQSRDRPLIRDPPALRDQLGRQLLHGGRRLAAIRDHRNQRLQPLDPMAGMMQQAHGRGSQAAGSALPGRDGAGQAGRMRQASRPPSSQANARGAPNSRAWECKRRRTACSRCKAARRGSSHASLATQAGCRWPAAKQARRVVCGADCSRASASRRGVRAQYSRTNSCIESVQRVGAKRRNPAHSGQGKPRG